MNHHTHTHSLSLSTLLACMLKVDGDRDRDPRPKNDKPHPTPAGTNTILFGRVNGVGPFFLDLPLKRQTLPDGKMLNSIEKLKNFCSWPRIS